MGGWGCRRGSRRVGPPTRQSSTGNLSIRAGKPSDDLPPGTLASILKQAGLKE
ncbi:MAG TPA: addiction module toxin, HicA family [Planctomycetaceae bacterium]|nr:addiction module toxin, HicA family [Planctomycetaceae bacterium]